MSDQDSISKELKKPEPAHTNTYNGSEWEIPEEGVTKKRRFRAKFASTATRWAIADRFDRVLPPHKRYMGRSRKTFLICICVGFLALVALAIGLGVGLTKKHKWVTPS